jgi:hypothetical protein
MITTIVKLVGGVLVVGVGIFAAIAGAGVAGNALEEAFGTPEKTGDSEPIRRAS